MTNKILNGVKFFKENFPKSKEYIQRMQQLSDIDDIDFKTFQSTGLFMSVDDFKKACPSANLSKGCEVVVMYISLDYVQSLDSGYFSRGRSRSRDLSVIEKRIHDEYKASL